MGPHQRAGSLTGLVVLWLTGIAGAEPTPPDSVWVDSYDAGFVELRWTAVESAVHYVVYRGMVVDLDIKGSTPGLPPGMAWVRWVPYVEPPERKEPVVAARIALLDEEESPWAVAAVDAEGRESGLSTTSQADGILTGVRSATWGQVKGAPKKGHP